MPLTATAIAGGLPASTDADVQGASGRIDWCIGANMSPARPVGRARIAVANRRDTPPLEPNPTLRPPLHMRCRRDVKQTEHAPV